MQAVAGDGLGVMLGLGRQAGELAGIQLGAALRVQVYHADRQ